MSKSGKGKRKDKNSAKGSTGGSSKPNAERSKKGSPKKSFKSDSKSKYGGHSSAKGDGSMSDRKSPDGRSGKNKHRHGKKFSDQQKFGQKSPKGFKEEKGRPAAGAGTHQGPGANDRSTRSAKSGAKTYPAGTFFGYQLESLLTEADLHQGAVTEVGLLEGCAAYLIVAGPTTKEEDLRRILKGQLPEWALKELQSKISATSITPDVSRFTAEGGALFVAYQGKGGGYPVRGSSESSAQKTDDLPKDLHGNLYRQSYGIIRDLTGSALNQLRDLQPESLQIVILGCDEEATLGALTAVDLAAYRFRPTQEEKVVPVWRPKLVLSGVSEQTAAEAGAGGVATNMARHLVNLPAGHLNPVTYARGLTELFSSAESVKVDVWDEKRIEADGLGLLAAVGRGAEAPPRLVHLRYRPSSQTSDGPAATRPVALVGKGITFDSGGLDIKPSSGMRWMKKDMGGSATLVGLAYWLWQSNCPVPCDIYLALAENAVDERSFRPGDILTARNGLTVEIHNTDAEGRLVLADAIDVALDQPEGEQPAAILDFATLTGAMRVGLGLKVAGLLSDNDELADRLEASGKVRSDYLWRMPLFHDYTALLSSEVAAISNSASGRFGGAITAALFLKQFVREVPWAHVDMHAWTGSPSGPLGEPGGNGQGVQLLIHLLSHWSYEETTVEQ